MHCWYWVADWCAEQNIDFILEHALYMKAIHGGKTKNDKVDSYKIAKLLRGGNFPMAYEFPQEMRATRDLLRRRSRLVRYSGELKAHVKNTASQYNLPDLNRLNLRYENNREQVRELFPDDMVQTSVDLDLDLVTFFDKELGKIEWKLKKHTQKFNSKEFSLLKTVPGIGDILALTIVYEIGEISRFPLFRNLPPTAGWSNAKRNRQAKFTELRATRLATPISSGPSQKQRFFT